MTASPNTPTPSPTGQRTNTSGAVIAQLAILALTYLAGILGVFLTQSTWWAAIAFTAVGIAVIEGLVSRYPVVVVLVPLASLVATIGLALASHTTAVACNGETVEEFKKLSVPAGASVELFASPSQGCMAELTSTQVKPDQVARHYRSEFTRQGWDIVSDDPEELRGALGDVYVVVYGAEGKAYFILGHCGDWDSPCGDG